VSLLTLVQGAADRLTLPRPTSVASSTDELTRALFKLANEEGISLNRRCAWQRMVTEKTFTTVAAALQTSSVPTDFDWYIPDTMYNRTQTRRVHGPISSAEWQAAQASLVTRVVDTFRFRGNSILITPTPSAGETIAYEYVSKNWCESSGGTDQAAFAADEDVSFLDEELLILGVVWRFRQSKGFDYAEAFAKYEREVNQAMSRDGAKPRLYMSGTHSDRIPMAPIVPETLVGL
jgi:hypothetical protein